MGRAIREELSPLGEVVMEKNQDQALAAYDGMSAYAGAVSESEERPATEWLAPGWIDLSFEPTGISSPTIRAADTSAQLQTGLWRTMRPVVDYDHCNRCWWVCSTFCPDGAIAVTEQRQPRIDYDHCKGCLICVTQCPPHAIEAIPEYLAVARDNAQGVS
jgi:pyruvate ferredoxin oxidoreductase gamma subunit